MTFYYFLVQTFLLLIYYSYIHWPRFKLKKNNPGQKDSTPLRPDLRGARYFLSPGPSAGYQKGTGPQVDPTKRMTPSHERNATALRCDLSRTSTDYPIQAGSCRATLTRGPVLTDIIFTLCHSSFIYKAHSSLPRTSPRPF